MPTYTYFCTVCSKKSDFLIGVNQEKNKLACPYCGSKKIRKEISIFAISTSPKETFSSPPPSASKCSSCYTRNCSSCS